MALRLVGDRGLADVRVTASQRDGGTMTHIDCVNGCPQASKSGHLVSAGGRKPAAR